MISHYDSDSDGVVSYKDFLDLMLPKEHPTLRSFITQRECYDSRQVREFSRETEHCMALLLQEEMKMLDFAAP